MGAPERNVWRGRRRPLAADDAAPSRVHLGAREADGGVAVEMPYLHARDIAFRAHLTEGRPYADGLLSVREHEAYLP